MPSSICFITELLYRFNQQGLIASTSSTHANWGILLQYQANTVAAAIGQLAQAFNPTGWAYWYNRIFTSASAWIDGSGTSEDPVDSLTEVQVQFGNGTVGALPAWCNPSQASILYQYGGGIYFGPDNLGAGSGFDYTTGTRRGGGSGSPSGSNYTPAMRNTNTAYTVDTVAPTFGTFSPASGGTVGSGAAVITGSVSSPNAIASVGYSVNGGAEQGAALTLNLQTGPSIPPTQFGWTSAWTWNMQFSAPVTLLSGDNSIVFTVTTVSGLTATSTWTCNGGASPTPLVVQSAAVTLGANGNQLVTPNISTTTGNGLVFVVVLRQPTDTVSSITDGAGNTWARLPAPAGRTSITSGISLEVWGTTNSNPTGLSNQKITVNCTNTTVAGRWFEISGGTPSAQVDKSASAGAAGSTAMASGNTGTLSAAHELALGIFGGGVRTLTGPTFTQGVENTSYPSATGWDESTGSSNVWLHCGVLSITNTTGQQYSGTLNAAGSWIAAVVVLA